MYIFGGSQTIGHLLEGWSIDTILEMTDGMTECNAYHFSKNYKNIDIILPKQYENNEEYLETLKELAESLSELVRFVSDEQRQYLHIAAVFANNFTNHLFGISKEILGKNNIPFEMLFPIIDRTIENIKTSDDIFSLQTGPAIRGDFNIMNLHIDKLSSRESELYSAMSKSILDYHKD